MTPSLAAGIASNICDWLGKNGNVLCCYFLLTAWHHPGPGNLTFFDTWFGK
jgi:hypothetical protein